MDNKEKISVELELLTEKFSNKIKIMTSKISSFGKYAKQHLVVKDEGFDLTGAMTDLVDIRDKMNQATDPKIFNQYAKTALAIAKDIEEYTDETEEATKSTNKFGLTVSKNFSKGISSVKKFALSLFSIRSIFSLVSRASSSYISHDTALANKLQAVWVGLGSLLEPLINSIANAMLKLVGYINAFVKGLTGADLLAKGINKSLNNAARNASNLVAPFDEISNINENSSGGGLDTSWVSAFDNIELNQKWVTFFEKLGKSFKNLSSYIPIIIGSAALLTGLLGINQILLGIAAIGVITIGVKVISEGVKDHKAILEDSAKSSDNLVSSSNQVIDAFKKIQSQTGLTDKQVQDYIQTLNNQLDSHNELIKSYEEEEDWLSYIDGSATELEKSKQALADQNLYLVDTMWDLYQQGKLSDSQEKEYAENIKNTIEQLKKCRTNYDENKKSIEKLQDKLQKLTGQKYETEVKVEADTKPAKNKLSSFFKNMGSSLFSAIFPTSSFISVLSKIASLDVGTNYVPNDQLAMIHKGEAVIPKEFNSKEYFNSSNDETNSLLRELITTLEDKDMNTYLDGKIIGKTAQNYINNQSRIMGRSVI